MKLIKIKMENEFLKKELEKSNKDNSELKSFIKFGKNNNKNYNISINNYIQQNYTDAPPLTALINYEQLIYEAEEIENDDEFTSLLINYYKRNKLHEYFGNFIIKHYKKDNPKEQSIWSSDVTRLKYIIRELLANNVSIWNNDLNGLKTQKCIVDPLLKYVQEHLEKYKKDSMASLTIIDKRTLDRQQSYSLVCKISNDIDNGTLSNDIVKYIALHFKFTINEFIEYDTTQNNNN